MFVPLLADGKCIGSITLHEGKKVRQWLSSDIDLAKDGSRLEPGRSLYSSHTYIKKLANKLNAYWS